MGRFITEKQEQPTRDILLLREAQNTRENFEDLHRAFGTAEKELSQPQQNNLSIDGSHFNLKCPFVGDYKAIYAFLGMFNATGS